MKKKAGPSETVSSPQMSSKMKSVKSIPKEEDTGNAVMVLPPDGGWGWVVVFATLYSFVISDGVIFSYGIFLKDIANSLNCSQSEVSLAGAIQTCFYCLAGPFSAALINRFGFRIVATIGCLLGTISCGLTSVSEDMYQISVAYGFVGGIGFGMAYVSGIIVIGFYFERWRALASGISLCGAGVGGTAMPPILTILMDLFGWRHTFRLAALMVLTCVICTLLYRPIKPTRVTIEQEGLVKRTLSHISEVQETKSKQSQFFLQYNNATYPTVANANPSVIALLRPPKVTLMRSASSEIMSTTLASDTSQLQVCGKIGLNKSKYLNIARCCTFRKCSRRKTEPGAGKDMQVSSYVNPIGVPQRPLYRDDIFYSGSLLTLPEYKKSQALRTVESKPKSVLEYHISVTRTTTAQDMEEQTKCTVCPEAVKRTLATMLDFHLLRSPSFLLLIVNSICIAYAFYTPFVYIKDRAVENGISSTTAVWLISAIGAMNTIGRILCGVLSSFPKVRAHIVCGVLLFFGGVATIVSEFSFSIWAQFLYAAVYGISIASIAALRSVIIVDILGLDKLTNAIGMILLFQGIASLAGTALSGFLREITGDYKISFFLAGGALCVGSIFLLPIKTVSNLEKRKTQASRI